MPIDETELTTYISNLNSKANELETQLGQIRLITNNLGKIRQVVASTTIDQKTGTRTNTMSNPIDPDLGSDAIMTDDKRQAIYDANKAQADKVLSQMPEQENLPPPMPQQKSLSLADIVTLKQANLNQRVAMIDTLKKLEMEDAQLTQMLINLAGQKPPNRAEKRRLEREAKKKK